MKYKINVVPKNEYVYCCIRIKHNYVKNKTIYHLAEHLFFNGIEISKLNIKQGFKSANFIYTAVAFTDRASINICFISEKKNLKKIKKMFAYIKNKQYRIIYEKFDYHKKYVAEEIINRKEVPYFWWRDEILNRTLKNTNLNFNEVGEIEELEKLTVDNVKDYLKDIDFNFNIKIENKEYTSFKNDKKNIDVNVNNIIYSKIQRKLSVISVIPINTKDDYISSLVFTDYLFNLTDSVIEKILCAQDLNDTQYEMEIYDNCIIPHFTVKYKNETNINDLIKSIKNVFTQDCDLQKKEIFRRLKRLQLQNELPTTTKVYGSYFRLLKNMNKKYLLSSNDFMKIDIGKIINTFSRLISHLDNVIYAD